MTTVNDIPSDQLDANSTLVVLSADATVQFALQELDKFNLTSAPVLTRDGLVAGFLDVVDIVSFLTSVAERQVGSSASLKQDDIGQISKRAAEFNLTNIMEMVELSKNNPYFPVRHDASIKEAVDVFLRGPHRLAITDDRNKIVKILTQSNMVRYFAQDTHRIPSFRGDVPASQVMKPVVSISSTLPAIDAFRRMRGLHLTSLAIVDANGILGGIISASDVKALKEYRFLKLLSPVSEYVALVRAEQQKPANYSVVCSPDTPMSTVIKRVAHERVHRIFVVNERNEPLGVISLTDILHHCYN